MTASLAAHPDDTGHHSPQTRGEAGFGEFFRYHGWLSPGVRLFRSLGFKAKAAWMALTFLIPLALLIQFVWAGANDRIQAAESERQGLAYANPIVQLVKVAQDRRLAYSTGAADAAQWQDTVKAAFERVAQAEAASGKTFGTTETFAALKAAHDGLLQAPVAASPDATFKAHANYIDTALALMNQVANGSQLALDPDLDTFHMMNFSVLRGPLQLENTGRLRDMGHIVLSAKQMTQDQRDRMLQWSAVWTYLDQDVENSYHEGIERFPEMARLLDMKGADEASDNFRKAIAQQILGAGLAGEAEAFAGIGRDAADRQLSLVYSVMGLLDQRLQARQSAVRNTLAWQIGSTAFFLALAGYMMLAFYKVMMGGLQEVASHLRAIAAGNLTTAPRPWGKDEAAGLMTAMGQMQVTLRRVMTAVLDSSAQVHTSSEEIASATNDLSRRTEQSAANLEQTAASTEQISATVKHTADTVNGAMAIARDNAAAALRGGEVIAQVVNTMQDIRGSSDKIGEIIGVIDGIAFQTNILALNAAVEAARAGEAGRGFAVVASEVRALAGRSAAAAREIKTLINASIEQVQSGTTVVADAGATIGVIVTNADKIASLMNEIASATREQSVGVGQVGAAVHELDQTTQQNAALVEETAAATTALSEQAKRLAEEVGFFRIEPALRRG